MEPFTSVVPTNFIAVDYDLENQWNKTSKTIKNRLENIEIQESNESQSVIRRLSYSETGLKNPKNWTKTASKIEKGSDNSNGISSRLRPRKQDSDAAQKLCYSKQHIFDKEKIEQQTSKNRNK